MNKEVVLYFDNNIEKFATLFLSASKFAKAKFNPPVLSSKMRVTVLSVYSKTNNGFSEIRVYENTTTPVIPPTTRMLKCVP